MSYEDSVLSSQNRALAMPTATAAQRPGPKPRTSRRDIAECALHLLEREGHEALGFRAVARELDMTVGALSRYFGNLADLEDEVAATIMSKLRPLDGKGGLRQQLLRMAIEILEINQAHPYLIRIHGPASARVTARHARQCLKVLTAAGLELDRAMSLYALVGNLPYAWATQATRRPDAERDARIADAFLGELGEFAADTKALLAADSSTAVFRRWLLTYIDALLAAPPARAA
jgi:AcrR family transcriptional regulator